MKTNKCFLLAAICIAFAFTFSGCSSDDDGGGNCDIQDYETVTIGTQIWTAENLNCNVSGGVCYDNDPANCAKYGRLYDWATAMALPSSCNSNSCSNQVKTKHQGICPSGWHIPSDEEWTVLTDYAGGSSTAGIKLKATNGWNNNGNGTNDRSFAALPGGDGFSGGYGSSGGEFKNIGENGTWWSATEHKSGNAYYRTMDYLSDDVYRGNDDKPHLFSVRCIKD
jgi:uncharacterized protein (TIGR02145 family)